MRSRSTSRTTRAVHVTIATISLAAPASALALSGAVADGQGTDTAAVTPETVLHLRNAPRRVHYGHPMTISGRASRPAAGQTMQLQTVADGGSSWRRMDSATIGPRGGFKLRAPLRRSGLVRLVSVTPQGVQQPVGPAQHVSVTADLRVRPRSVDVLGSGPVNVQGRLFPERPGSPVQLQAHYATGWHTLASTRTGQAGGFRLRTTPHSGLDRKLRVVFPGDGTNARTTRSAGSMTVYGDESVASWYDDSGTTGCGFHAGLGVANKSLPCGTKVRFHYGGRSVTAVVDDRGPYVGGRTWDLNQNTAGALGFGGVGTVWATQ